MGFLLVMLLAFMVVLALLLGLSVGVALVMTWLFPPVGLDTFPWADDRATPVMPRCAESSAGNCGAP